LRLGKRSRVEEEEEEEEEEKEIGECGDGRKRGLLEL